MHFFAVALTIAATAIGSTSASAVAPRALVSVNQASSSLLSRQVATACVNTCDSADNELTTCGTNTACLCSPTLASELSDCVNCRLNGDPTLRSQLETAWDQYSSGCASLGFPVSGGIDDGSSVTPTVFATPTTTTPAVVSTPSPIVTSAAAAVSSAAPAVVATACASTCTPVQNAETTCIQPSCMCSPSYASELSACANCRLQNDPTLRSELETAWDQYSSSCATFRLPVSGGIDGGTTTAPAVSTTSTASSSGSNYDGGLFAHANAAPNIHAGGALCLLVVGVVAALL